MQTRLILLTCCLCCSVRAYTLFDAVDEQQSCPAFAKTREILTPHHNTNHNVQHQQEVCRTRDRPFKPMQWLLRIIRIRTMPRDEPKYRIQNPRVPQSAALRHDSRGSEDVKRNAKMLLILDNRPVLEQQPNHFFM
ncbi:hypothetical protein KR093_011317 [Drosophila rubida]|uniref:Secreted protein n=1 Tax=Drosophila rubida TaxID=30044 RepID=A0AAD4JV75_9MUSC|nr:hypothetical protein KR093_011317 [Drosophila rubida]